MAESKLRIANYLDVTLKHSDGSFTTNQISFSTLTNSLTSYRILLNTCQHLLKNSFQAILRGKKYLQKLLLTKKIHLNKAGYINKLVYHTPSASNQENKNKNRQRNVTWFNPPYCKCLTTRIVQSFLYLLDTHFPKNHTVKKIFKK